MKQSTLAEHTREDILALATEMDDSALSELVTSLRSRLQARGVGLCCDKPKEPKPARMFSVPEGMRYMDSAQLAALTRAVDEWTEQPVSPQIRHSRRRLRLVYLMLRYSGAKVGEVLALDEERDLDFAAGEVIFRAQEHAENTAPGDATPADLERRVPLPAQLMRELKDFLASPQARRQRSRLFQMDQGFVRRKLAEQTERAPVPRELLNPTVLRHSRAVELLRQGVPLPVVQRLLGHASVVLTAAYCSFSERDTQRILRHHVNAPQGLKTSARNAFHGSVAQVAAGRMLTEVVLRTKADLEISATITNHSAEALSIRPGRPVSAIVKAPFVLATTGKEPGFPGTLNMFRGTVTAMESDGAYLQVRGLLSDGTSLCSLIPYAAPEATRLKAGNSAWFSFSAMSVTLIAE